MNIKKKKKKMKNHKKNSNNKNYLKKNFIEFFDRQQRVSDLRTLHFQADK